MEIRNLNAFLKVAALKNFTHAAKELGYAQSNISAQIAQLEQELGVPLFNRIGRQISLTQYGEELLPYAQELCSTAAKIENLHKSEQLLGGTVRIGVTDSISEMLPEASFLAYHRRFPRVRLEIVLDTTVRLQDRLRRGELDAACVITDPLPAAEWTIWKEIQVPVVVAANPALAITKKKSVKLSELAAQKLVLMERDAPYSMQFEKELLQHHLECNPVFRLQSAQTALNIVMRDAFITVLPFYSVKAAADSGQTVILNTPEWQCRQSVQTILHQSKVLTPQISGFLAELEKDLDNVLAVDIAQRKTRSES